MSDAKAEKKQAAKASTHNKNNQPHYVLDDAKLNVLLLGTSGAGKSTLINAIIPGANAPTGKGLAITKEIKPYSDPEKSIVLIDTMGYELSVAKQKQVKSDIKKWTKDGVKKQDASKSVHMIWFCVDSQCGRVHYELFDGIRAIKKIWKGIPIIVVYTKSFGSDEEDLINAKTFFDVLDTYKHKEDLHIESDCLIPVVATEYSTAVGTIPPKGLDKLIEKTIELSPIGKAAAASVVRTLAYDLKRNQSMSLVGIFALSAATVGAVPIAFPDATVLVPLQTTMLGAIGNRYKDVGISPGDVTKALLDAGLSTMVAKQLLALLKGIPALGVIAGALNSIVAGTVTFALGSAAVAFYDGVLRGTIKPSTGIQIDTIIKELLDEYMPDVLDVLKESIQECVKDGPIELKDIPQIILTSIQKFVEKRVEKPDMPKNGN